MILGIDVGGTKTLVAMFNEHGEITNSTKFPTPVDYHKFITALTQTIADLTNVTAIEKIGMALPGPFDYEANVVKKFGNLPWKNVAPHSEISKSLSVPVVADNDANVAALYEANMGAAKGYSRSLYLTLSTGIGSGFTLNGAIDPLLRGSEAGDTYFEHDGEQQKWEEFASGKAFQKKYGTRASDETRPEVWAEYAKNVAVGLQNILAVTNVDVVVFGGGVGKNLAKFKQPLIQALNDHPDKLFEIPKLVIAEKQENSAIYGCYYLATHS